VILLRTREETCCCGASIKVIVPIYGENIKNNSNYKRGRPNLQARMMMRKRDGEMVKGI
jgi:hypothetical protein